MIKCNDCCRCGSTNVIKLIVSTNIALYYEDSNGTQWPKSPSDAMLCKDCGHIEFFRDPEI